VKELPKSAFLVGIGGAGMSALARMLHGLGVAVRGSDRADSPLLDQLRTMGIPVRVGHCGTALDWIPDSEWRSDGEAETWIIRSAAVPEDTPEFVSARRRGFLCVLYSEAIGRLSTGLKTIAIAGTHGKTSTTALTVAALHSAGLDPSYLIGGEVPSLSGNGHGGRDDLLVVEACEFNRSFHALRPSVAAILNVERDHFDCYPSRESLEESFALYASQLSAGGSLLVHESVTDTVIGRLPANIAVIRVGSGLFADVRALDVAQKFGRFSFTPYWDGTRLPRVDLKLHGSFQVLNALFAIGLAIQAGADPVAACRDLSRFDGVARRFQVQHGRNGGQLVDDYAHHPSEIRAVISTVRKAYPGRKILVAFQPHQYSRTRNLLEEFGAALAEADQCLVADIYAAREDPSVDHGVEVEDLVDAVRRAGGNAAAAGSTLRLGDRILNELEPGAIPVVLGAGELHGVVEEVVRRL